MPVTWGATVFQVDQRHGGPNGGGIAVHGGAAPAWGAGKGRTIVYAFTLAMLGGFPAAGGCDPGPRH